MNLIKRVLWGVVAPTLGVAVLFTAAPVEAESHTLVVDGVPYEHTHVAGPTFHWETPGANPQTASFAERGQTWVFGDNGSEHLPCEFGVHWLSNENTLNVSHCLDDPNETTTTTEDPTSTSTSTTAAPTTSSSSTSSTAPGLAATTSLPASTPTTQATPSSSSSPSTSTVVSPTTTLAPRLTALPKTGSGDGMIAAIAAVVLACGAAAGFAARRR